MRRTILFETSIPLSSSSCYNPHCQSFLSIQIHHSLLERHSPHLNTKLSPPHSNYLLVCSQQSLLNRQIKIQILDENPVLHALQSPPAAHPMLLPDPRHHKPPRRRERQRVHEPLLPKPDQKTAYNRNRTHFLQQLSVLRAVRHVRIPQSDAIIVAPARQQIRSVQRRAAHDPAPRRVLPADWTHRIHPVRVLPLKIPQNRDMDRKNGLFLGDREEIQRSVEIPRDEILRTNHRAALHALVDASPAENHLRGRFDLPQPHRIVRRAAQNPRGSPRPRGVSHPAEPGNQGLVPVSTREFPRFHDCTACRCRWCRRCSRASACCPALPSTARCLAAAAAN